MNATDTDTTLVDRIERAATAHAITYSTEAQLQAALDTALREEGVVAQREVRLSDGRSRIDFLSGRTGIEIKIDGSWTQVARQLMRYAKCAEIDALVLITSKVTHRQVPDEIAGVPVRKVFLTTAGAFL